MMVVVVVMMVRLMMMVDDMLWSLRFFVLFARLLAELVTALMLLLGPILAARARL
jgi:hypothetical protein